MKYDLIDSTMRQTYLVTLMCRVFGISANGFYAWRVRPPCMREQENARLEIKIQAAHQRTRETYSAKCLHSDLAYYGVKITLTRLQTLCNKLGLRCKQKCKFKVTTDSKHHLPVVPNVLKREFVVKASNKAWVSDITYIPIYENLLAV